MRLVLLLSICVATVSSIPVELAKATNRPPLTRLDQLPDVIAPRYGVHEYACKGNGCSGVKNVVCTRRGLKWKCTADHSKSITFHKPSVTCAGNSDGEVACSVHAWAAYRKMSVSESFFVAGSLILMVAVLGPFSLLLLLIPSGSDTVTSTYDDC